MKKNIILFVTIFVLNTCLAQQIKPRQTIALNCTTMVYLIFDQPIIEERFDVPKFDRDPLSDESIGLRFFPGYTPPIDGVNAMIVLAGKIYQPLTFIYQEKITETAILINNNPTQDSLKGKNEIVDTSDIVSPIDSTKRNTDSIMIAKLRSIVDVKNKQIPLEIQKKCDRLLKKRQINQIGSTANSIKADLYAVGVDKDYIYLTVYNYNSSNVDYNIDIQGFETKRTQKITDAITTTADVEFLQPLYSYEEFETLPPGRGSKFVLIYELFTLKNNQVLVFFMRERNGGRNVEFQVPNDYLLNAMQL